MGNANRNVKQALGLGLGLEELEWDFEHRQSMLSLKEDVERASFAGLYLISCSNLVEKEN